MSATITDPHRAILPGQHPPAYKVFVRRDGSPAAIQLVNSFNVAVFPVSAPSSDPAVTVAQDLQVIDGGQYYLYR